MAAILQPPRQYRLTVTINLPPDPRTDADMIVLLFSGVSLSCAIAQLAPQINIERGAPITGHPT